MSVGKFAVLFVVFSATAISMAFVWRDPNGPATGWPFPWWWRERPLRPYQLAGFRVAAVFFGLFALALLIGLIVKAVA